MFEELRICRLTPDEVDNKTIQSICDIWSSAKSLTDGKKTDPGLMCTVNTDGHITTINTAKVWVDVRAGIALKELLLLLCIF